MNRPFFACVLIALSSAALCAQQSSSQNPYQGTSNPPADDAIVTDAQPAAQPQQPIAKPSPGVPMNAAQAAPNYDQQQAQQPADSGAALPPPAVAPQPLPPPALQTRAYADPDGDIVHPDSNLPPGAIGEGTTIRVRLLDRLSTAQTERGEAFHSQVASDVYQGSQMLIPAGAEIDGTVVSVSSGHAGGTGSMRLRPEWIIFADGSRYELHAELTGTPGSNTHVVGEGTVKPDSRWKRDSIEYGGAVGAGVITGAVVAGPVGALTGGLIGAGAVTTHLLVSHPQATLDPGTSLLFTLTEPLSMTAAPPSGN